MYLCKAAFLISLLICVHSQPQLTCPDVFCLSQPTTCTCQVNAGTLGWTVRDTNGVLAGSTSHSRLSVIQFDLNTPYQLSNSIGFNSTLTNTTDPVIVADLSFTAALSIEGYSIVCNDGNMFSPSVSVNITSPPTVVNSMSFTANSFTSVTVSWSPPSVQQCLTNYQLVINNTNSNQQETINTNSIATTHTINNRINGIEYCYTVSAVNVANRIGPQSNSNCFTLDTPLQPIITSVRATNYPTDLSGDNITVDVIAEWMRNASSRPPVLRYVVTHNISTTDNSINTTATNVTITGAILGSTYYIEVLASNTLGIGLPTQTVTVIPTVISTTPVIPTTSVVSTSISTVISTPTPTTSSTPSVLSTGAIVGIIIGVIAIVVILVVILIAVLVYILVKKKNRPKEKKAVAPQSEEVFYADLEVSSSSNNRKPKGKPAKQPVAHEPVQYSALQHSQQQHYADIDHSGSSGRRGVPEDRSAVEYREIQQH